MPSDRYGPNGAAVEVLLREIASLDEARIDAITDGWRADRADDALYDLGRDLFSANPRHEEQAAARQDAWTAVDNRLRTLRLSNTTPIEESVRRVATLLVYRDLLGETTFERLYRFWTAGRRPRA